MPQDTFSRYCFVNYNAQRRCTQINILIFVKERKLVRERKECSLRLPYNVYTQHSRL